MPWLNHHPSSPAVPGLRPVKRPPHNQKTAGGGAFFAGVAPLRLRALSRWIVRRRVPSGAAPRCNACKKSSIQRTLQGPSNGTTRSQNQKPTSADL